MSAEENVEMRWLTEDERGAWLAMVGLLVRLPTELDAQLQADAGLSFFEYMVLAVLAEQPDHALQMSDIAAFASSSLSRLSHTASRLEKQGLITRHQIGGHGRRRRAVLTDVGFDKIRAAAAGHVTHVRRMVIDDLSVEDLATLTRIGARVGARVAHAADRRDGD